MRFDLEFWRFGERAEERIKRGGRGKERGEGVVSIPLFGCFNK
jgi:hypothetical protein